MGDGVFRRHPPGSVGFRFAARFDSRSSSSALTRSPLHSRCASALRIPLLPARESGFPIFCDAGQRPPALAFAYRLYEFAQFLLPPAPLESFPGCLPFPRGSFRPGSVPCPLITLGCDPHPGQSRSGLFESGGLSAMCVVYRSQICRLDNKVWIKCAHAVKVRKS